MKYLLIQHQDNGCDYTIGCGTLVTTLEAKNAEDAYEEASETLMDSGLLDVENPLTSAYVVAFVQEMPLAKLRKQAKEANDAEEAIQELQQACR